MYTKAKLQIFVACGALKTQDAHMLDHPDRGWRLQQGAAGASWRPCGRPARGARGARAAGARGASEQERGALPASCEAVTR
jgi:hypothetical protein